jgi:hypothetical protein
MSDVVTLAEPNAAAWESTAAVAVMERASQRRWNGTRSRADFDRPAFRIVSHDHARRVARQALRRFCRNARAAFEDRLARRIGFCQDRCIDVNDDLVSLARATRIDAVMKRRLGE